MVHATATSRMVSLLRNLLKHALAVTLSLAITCWAYLLCAALLFGSIVKPVLFFFIANELWKFLILIGLVVGAWTARQTLQRPGFGLFTAKPIKPAFYVVASILIAVFLSGIAATAMRRVAIVRLAPDQIHTATFISSLHKAGSEVVPHPHAVALKDCEAFAWSYRSMSFYQLSDGVARNVLPHRWVAKWKSECRIVLE